MEQQFNIGNVIEHYKLNTEDLAKVLFPTVKYPKQAFDRVLKGEANLDVIQLERLANHICFQQILGKVHLKMDA